VTRQEAKIEWQESISEFQQLWQTEPSTERRQRLHALLLLRIGFRQTDVTELVQMNRQRVRYLISAYRRKGVIHALGYMVHPDANLTFEQQRELVAHAQNGGFETLNDALEWVEQRWGVRYALPGMRMLFSKLDIQTRTQRFGRSKKVDC